MKRLLRRLSRAVAAAEAEAGAALDSSTASWRLRRGPKEGKQRKRRAAGVPEGHVPVCVGEEGGPVERFAVRAELLGDPAFAALLRRAAHEYGYAHPGALRIPCPVADFRRLLLRLSADPAARACACAY